MRVSEGAKEEASGWRAHLYVGRLQVETLGTGKLIMVTDAPLSLSPCPTPPASPPPTARYEGSSNSGFTDL